MKWRKIMDATLVLGVVSVAAVASVGLYCYSKMLKKQTNNADVLPSKAKIMPPDLTIKLDEIIKIYEQDCLRYYVFAWGNRKQISVAVENKLKEKYPSIFSLPTLDLSVHFSNQKAEQRKAVLAYLQQYHIVVDETTHETTPLKNFLQERAEKAAEKIVDEVISQQKN